MRMAVGWLLALTAPMVAAGQVPTVLVVIRHDIPIAATPDRVWAKIGDYCAVIRILGSPCAYVAGSGEVGTVRSLRDGATLEPLVARTAHSYTYSQTRGAYAGYGYHGTIAAEPGENGATRLSYTIVFDPAAVPVDALAALRTQIDRRAAVVVAAIRNAVESDRTEYGDATRPQR